MFFSELLLLHPCCSFPPFHFFSNDSFLSSCPLLQCLLSSHLQKGSLTCHGPCSAGIRVHAWQQYDQTHVPCSSSRDTCFANLCLVKSRDHTLEAQSLGTRDALSFQEGSWSHHVTLTVDSVQNLLRAASVSIFPQYMTLCRLQTCVCYIKLNFHNFDEQSIHNKCN